MELNFIIIGECVLHIFYGKKLSDNFQVPFTNTFFFLLKKSQIITK